LTSQGSAQQETELELGITQIFDAPRELVFKVWTDPKHFAQWWGPRGFTSPVCELDLRPGGAILVHMRGPDGAVFPMKGEFREIVAPARLVFTATGMEDSDGNPQLENLNTVTFAKHNGKTKLTLHVVVVKFPPEAADSLAGMESGWGQSLDRLADLLAKS
jgi:uncharacterized protein YndB with AHSA1/START domain